MKNTPLHCGRPMHGHGWDHQLKNHSPRRRYRCPICGSVDVENPQRNKNGSRGQIYETNRGRKRIYLGRGHQYANSGGWQYLSRFIVSKAIGRRLRTDEHAHHKNRNRKEDQLENLELILAEYHGWLHASAVVLARNKNGQFVELESPEGPFSWPRNGPILG